MKPGGRRLVAGARRYYYNDAANPSNSTSGHFPYDYKEARPPPLEYPFVWRKGVLNGVLEYARLAMGFANVRAARYGTR